MKTTHRLGTTAIYSSGCETEIKEQITACRAFFNDLASAGVTFLDQTYSDTDSQGDTGSGLQHLISDSEAGAIDALIVTALNRLSHDPARLVKLLLRLAEYDTIVIATEDRFCSDGMRIREIFPDMTMQEKNDDEQE